MTDDAREASTLVLEAFETDATGRSPDPRRSTRMEG